MLGVPAVMRGPAACGVAPVMDEMAAQAAVCANAMTEADSFHKAP
jgi:hypothetical protein